MDVAKDVGLEEVVESPAVRKFYCLKWILQKGSFFLTCLKRGLWGLRHNESVNFLTT